MRNGTVAILGVVDWDKGNAYSGNSRSISSFSSINLRIYFYVLFVNIKVKQFFCLRLDVNLIP